MPKQKKTLFFSGRVSVYGSLFKTLPDTSHTSINDMFSNDQRTESMALCGYLKGLTASVGPFPGTIA